MHDYKYNFLEIYYYKDYKYDIENFLKCITNIAVAKNERKLTKELSYILEYYPNYKKPINEILF